MRRYVVVVVSNKPIDPATVREIEALGPDFIISTGVEINPDGRSYTCASVAGGEGSIMPPHLNGKSYKARGGDEVRSFAGFVTGLLSNPRLKPWGSDDS